MEADNESAPCPLFSLWLIDSFARHSNNVPLHVYLVFRAALTANYKIQSTLMELILHAQYYVRQLRTRRRKDRDPNLNDQWGEAENCVNFIGQ